MRCVVVGWLAGGRWVCRGPLRALYERAVCFRARKCGGFAAAGGGVKGDGVMRRLHGGLSVKRLSEGCCWEMKIVWNGTGGRAYIRWGKRGACGAAIALREQVCAAIGLCVLGSTWGSMQTLIPDMMCAQTKLALMQPLPYAHVAAKPRCKSRTNWDLGDLAVRTV